MEEIIIRAFNGNILAKISVDSNGDKTVRDFSGKTLGFYRKDRDVTMDFFGNVVAKGDACGMLIKK